MDDVEETVAATYAAGTRAPVDKVRVLYVDTDRGFALVKHPCGYYGPGRWPLYVSPWVDHRSTKRVWDSGVHGMLTPARSAALVYLEQGG